MMNSDTRFDGASLQLVTDTDQNHMNKGDITYKEEMDNKAASPSSPTCKTAMNPNKLQTAYGVKALFCYKEGAFQTAVEMCKTEILTSGVDINLKGAWLLTEIDHWDNEKEKMLIVTDTSLLVIKYDFITMTIKDFKRIMLHLIEKVEVGDFTYPEKSLMQPRNHGGIRVLWTKNLELSFGQKWNPFCETIPYTCFAHHPLVYHDKEENNPVYNVDNFYESLVEAINQSYQAKRRGEALQVIVGPIQIESYASLSSMVFNQSNLGFSRERGGVSF